MREDLGFRPLLCLALGAFGGIWLVRLWAVRTRRDVFYTRTEGLLLGVPPRLLLPVSIGAMVIYLIDPRRMAWSALPLSRAVRLLGVPLGALAAAVLWWSTSSLGGNVSLSLAVRNDQTLVTSGPYRWVRHPMYSAQLLMWSSFGLLSANWFIGLTGIAAFVLTMLVRTPREEDMMLGRFGSEYRELMTRTGRFWPRLRRAEPRASRA